MTLYVDLPIPESRRQMEVMRESFLRLFGDWMAHCALGDIIFYYYFYVGPKCYIFFKLRCTLFL